MKTLKIVGWYFAISFLVWLALTVAYGATSSDVKQSPLYNTETEEIRAVFVHFPIFAFLWPLVATILYGLLEWLPTCFLRVFKKS